MNSMDVDELLDKAYDGQISSEELAYVVDRIQKFYECPSNEDIDSLLQIVGYAGCFCPDWEKIINECRGLIEKFTIFPQDPGASVTAFCVLCNDWDFTADYIPLIKQYIRGVEWDSGDDMRVKAMCIAGEYVKTSCDKKLLRMLLEIFGNEQEEKGMRELAYRCIYRALGNDRMRPPGIDINTFSQNVIAQETIAKAGPFHEKDLTGFTAKILPKIPLIYFGE